MTFNDDDTDNARNDFFAARKRERITAKSYSVTTNREVPIPKDMTHLQDKKPLPQHHLCHQQKRAQN
jgi:hypothetical protein